MQAFRMCRQLSTRIEALYRRNTYIDSGCTRNCGAGVTEWSEPHHMVIRPQRVGTGKVKESAKARDSLYANINFYANLSPMNCIVFIMQNFHENGLIFMLH